MKNFNYCQSLRLSPRIVDLRFHFSHAIWGVVHLRACKCLNILFTAHLSMFLFCFPSILSFINGLFITIHRALFIQFVLFA